MKNGFLNYSLSRRHFLAATGATAAAMALPDISYAQTMKLPDGFLFGAASASAQVESRHGRGRSNWDVFADQSAHIADGTSNALNTLFESRYAEDFKMLADAGVNAFRFSFAWPRIQPDGPGEPSAEGLDVYDRILDDMLGRDIKPLATIFHWDVPVWAGDLRDREITNRMADYADIVTRKFGDRISSWLALNEPNTVAAAGYGMGMQAPGIASRDACGAALHHLNLATGLMVRAAQANLPAEARISTTINLQPARALKDTPENKKAEEFADAFWNKAPLDPLFGRGYPDLVQPMVEKYIHDGDMDIITINPGFIGMNCYSHLFVEANDKSPLGFVPLLGVSPKGTMATDLFPVDASAITEMLMNLHENYGAPEIIITETGFALKDPEPVNGIVEDEKRVEYIRLYLKTAYDAIQRGVNLTGVVYWSATDNWEWAEGFQRTFGLIQIDRTTLNRIPKRSLEYWGKCARTNSVV